MSSRRVHGRFVTTNASDQRQLAAPQIANVSKLIRSALKWKKAWVTPTGLAPESSYKICKWVRVPKDEQDVDEAFSPAQDGDDEDEQMDEDQADDDEDKPDTPLPDTAQATPAAETPLETPTLELQTPELESPAVPLSSNPNAPALSSSLAGPPVTAASLAPGSEAATPAADAATPGLTADVSAASAGADTTGQSETPLPGNAIEVTNVAPGHTEAGQGDLGGTETAVEVHAPESAAPAAAAEDVEMADGEDKGAGVGETAVPVSEDAGLVHGEMKPPVPELAVTDGDHPPAEMEDKP